MTVEIVEPKQGDLRVYWIPQVPMTGYIVPVDSVTEAVKIMDVLANYDLFQLKHNVKPDYCNMGMLQMYDAEEAEWLDWNLEFDVTIRGVRYTEWFECTDGFLEFLYQNNLTEQEVYEAMNLKGGE